MSNRETNEILGDLIAERKKIEDALDGIGKLCVELTFIRDEVEPPEVEPVVEVRPPVVTGPEDRIYDRLDADMTSIEIATAISEAPPGTTFECHGSLPMIRIGGILGNKKGKHNTVAHHTDGSPVTDIHFEAANGHSEIMGLLFHNSLGGFDDVRFKGFSLYPRQMGDRAAVMCEDHFDPDKFQGGLLGLKDCSIWAAKGEGNKWDGYKYKQGIVVRSSRVDFDDLYIQSPREHAMYLHNMMGDSTIRDISNVVQIVNGHTVGCGRSMIQIQERRKDGLESYGYISVMGIRGTLCGSEGVFAGNTATGAAALTVGGHRGTVSFFDVYLEDQLTAVIANWVETKSGVNKGYRDPSIDHVAYRDVTWNTHDHPLQSPRVKIKISGTKTLSAKNVGPLGQRITDPWTSPHVKLNDDPCAWPLTPATVDWR